MDEQGEVVELFADEDRLERVAAIDIGKSTAMVCTRVPSEKNPERRVQKTFGVGTTMAAISVLAEQLTGLGVELLVMESSETGQAASDHDDVSVHGKTSHPLISPARRPG